MMRFVAIICCLFLSLNANSQARFNERSRVAIGGGGTLAFQTIGGYNARAYLQFSQKWKMVFAASDFFTYNSKTKATSKHRNYDFNILHARKEYNNYDVFYLFEGVSVEWWTRGYEPKMPFRKIMIVESATDTVSLVPSLNIGIGFEKPIGPIGFYAELKIGIGAPELATVTFGIKTNLKRLFRGPNKRYDLDLEEEL